MPSSSTRDSLRQDIAFTQNAIINTERVKPLLNAVISHEPDEILWDKVYEAVTESTPPPRPLPFIQQTPSTPNTCSLADSSEEELSLSIYVGVPGFVDAHFAHIAGLDLLAQAVFEKCTDKDEAVYSQNRWREWPDGANEKDVIAWFEKVVGWLVKVADGHQLVQNTTTKLLARPGQPLGGFASKRKLDIGFVDGSDAVKNWSQVLVPGELKSDPSADTALTTWLDLARYASIVLSVQDARRFILGFTLCGSRMRLFQFDRLGGIASVPFDIHKDALQFVSVVLGFLCMDREQLGFDHTIVSDGNLRYIEVVRDGQKERLIIDHLINKVSGIAGRATTCWKAHHEGNSSTLVIKDSWQYPEREEGKLLREATEKGVSNIARYYHHETVQVGGKEDDVQYNVRKGLNITEATNFKSEISKTGKNRGQSSITNRKRSSSKRPCPSSSARLGQNILPNRIHRRVIIRDYGKPIYHASSRVALLVALEGCIKGYESLHTLGGVLHCDISPANLIINEEKDSLSWPAFLIDLDLAIKEQRQASSRAQGTRAFMAVGLLFGEQHSFMHDLESFFWVLFWICIHYEGPNKSRWVQRYELWNKLDARSLAELKLGVVTVEILFLQTAEEYFTTYYQPLIPWINRLRRVVFPGGVGWPSRDRQLYDKMKEVLQQAQKDPKV